MLARGDDVIAMGGAQLDKPELDKISATQPILVWDASKHFVYANSAALEKYKVTRDDTKFTGIMAGPDGEPTHRYISHGADGKACALGKHLRLALPYQLESE